MGTKNVQKGSDTDDEYDKLINQGNKRIEALTSPSKSDVSPSRSPGPLIEQIPNTSGDNDRVANNTKKSSTVKPRSKSIRKRKLLLNDHVSNESQPITSRNNSRNRRSSFLEQSYHEASTSESDDDHHGKSSTVPARSKSVKRRKRMNSDESYTITGRRAKTGRKPSVHKSPAIKSRQMSKRKNSLHEEKPCTSKQANYKRSMSYSCTPYNGSDNDEITVRPPRALSTVSSRKRQKTDKALDNKEKVTTFEISKNLSQNNVPGGLSLDHLVANLAEIDITLAGKIIKLFDEDNTIPFLCRYRKESINDMTPERMRIIKSAYKTALQIRTKAESVVKMLQKKEIISEDLLKDIYNAHSIGEIEEIYAPYKQQGKKKLSERAKAVGLYPPAKDLIDGEIEVNLNDYIERCTPERESFEAVFTGIKHIISDIMSSDPDLLSEIEYLKTRNEITITSKVVRDVTKVTGNPDKFSQYFDFEKDIKYIQPHQILAINRGENLKILNVKLKIPPSFKRLLTYFMVNGYLNKGNVYNKSREKIIKEAFEDAYTLKINRMIRRKIRDTLTKHAQKAAIVCFEKNLKDLLLVCPIKGQSICAIDPGFKNGCKYAFIDENGGVLKTGVIDPHNNKNTARADGIYIAELLDKYNCTIIAIGNGTGSRETENWINSLYEEDIIDPDVVRHCSVPEQGVSIYSCSAEAMKELPDIQVNELSAVAIARRLCDPIGEYVKVEPRHLGVGMYQHDLNVNELDEVLDEVVRECVSFVGVDVNTASVNLLKYVAGLSPARAQNIFDHRLKNGPFKSRKDLCNVNLIGAKTFEQCAGFLRIDRFTAKCNNDPYNPLDATWVHPESYKVAEKLIKDQMFSLCDIGTEKFIHTMKRLSCEHLAKAQNVSLENMTSVITALQRELFKDYRTDFNKVPIFKSRYLDMYDLEIGTEVAGTVTNVLDFGCFIDIGIGFSAFAHVSAFNGLSPRLYDRVQAIVKNFNIELKRVGVSLIRNL